MELGKSIKDAKGKVQAVETTVRLNTEALIDGGLARSSNEASVMEVQRRGGVIRLELPFTTFGDERRMTGGLTKGIPITKGMVYRSFKKVKRNKGGCGVDGVSLKDFEEDLGNNLYVLWNRLASGSYFPMPVREKGIPKKDGGERKLGIPTVSDRIAQQVVKDYLEPRLDRIFHGSSYGYRPCRNAHQAISEVRKNTRRYHWVIDMDIKGFFNSVSHELLMKALEKHVSERWVLMYIYRWLEAPVETESGEVQISTGRGTPQGGVISPLLANLFLHYAFDKWIDRQEGDFKFVRYADDIVVHTTDQSSAEQMLGSIRQRMTECGLELHEGKTRIVFCKRYDYRSSHEEVSFDFLGYTFQPRPSCGQGGSGMFLGYDCAISKLSQQKIASTIRRTQFQKWTGRRIEELAEFFNPRLQGWINYFGRFRLRNLNRIFKIFNRRLTKWVQNRHKRLKKSYIKASKWLREYKELYPDLFAHWRVGFINS